MTDLNFDDDDRGQLARGPEVRLTRVELDALRKRSAAQGVKQTSFVRAAVRRALDTAPDARAVEAEGELVARKKAGAGKTNKR